MVYAGQSVVLIVNDDDVIARQTTQWTDGFLNSSANQEHNSC